MSDVTAEEIERERERAHRMLTDARYMPCTRPDHNADCDVFATALAARAREARRDALKQAEGIASDEANEAENKVSYYNEAAATADKIADEIGALLGPET